MKFWEKKIYFANFTTEISVQVGPLVLLQEIFGQQTLSVKEM